MKNEEEEDDDDDDSIATPLFVVVVAFIIVIGFGTNNGLGREMYKDEEEDEEKPWLGRLRQAASSKSRMSIPYPLYHNIIMIVCRAGVGPLRLRRECCVAAVEVFIAEDLYTKEREKSSSAVHRPLTLISIWMPPPEATSL